MTRQTVLSWLCMIICGAMLASSCAGPPDDARQAAEQKIQGARDAEADVYAKDEFATVMAEWDKAEGYMQAQEYGEARTAYEKTMDLVDMAVRESEVGRETMKIEVKEKREEFKTMWGEISKSIEGKRTSAARDLAREAAEWVGQINQQLMELEQGQKYVEELAALEEATAKANEFKERAAGVR